MSVQPADGTVTRTFAFHSQNGVGLCDSNYRFVSSLGADDVFVSAKDLGGGTMRWHVWTDVGARFHCASDDALYAMSIDFTIESPAN